MSAARPLITGAALLLGLAILASCVPASAPGAGPRAVTFGSDLTRPANADVDCTTEPFDLSDGTRPPSSASTCTYTASPEGDAPGGGPWEAGGVADGPLAVPEGRGRLTAIRVSVGKRTGRMQFVVLRTSILRAKVGGVLRVARTCCTVQAVSKPFTPRARAITRVAVDIPVRHDTGQPRPGGEVLAIDAVGISVLTPGVPLPLHDTFGQSAVSGPPVAAFPAAQGGETGRLSLGTDRYEVLVAGEWVEERATPPPTVQALAVLSGARVAITVSCAGPARCAGTLHVDTAEVGSAASFGRYASATYAIAPGASATVRAPARGGPRIGDRVWVNVYAADGIRVGTRVTVRG